MLLEGKNAVIYGAAGHLGAAIARTFAREGARVHLAGRTAATLEAVARQVTDAGGTATTAVLDAHDGPAVQAHLDRVVVEAGSIEVSLNATSLGEVQGVPLVDMDLNDFLTPITTAARTHFLTTTAAARHMSVQGTGVVVVLSSSAARESGPLMGGFSLACAALECMVRTLAAEVGRRGVRVVALRPNAVPEISPQERPAAGDAFVGLAEATALGRLPRPHEVADAAAYLASDRASAMTGAILNLTCGALVD